jgi:hypothetical protein
MVIKKYRKIPRIISAVKWEGENVDDIKKLGGDKKRLYLVMDEDQCCLSIDTLEGIMIARPGDYIIRGIKGELYPCKPDIFQETYEELILSGN